MIMKHHIFCISVLFLTLLPGQEPQNVSQSFGKTHFILGFPHQKQTQAAENTQAPICTQPSKPCWKSGCPATICQAFFSPHDDLKTVLIDLIAREQKSIRVAIYMFTDKELAQALIDAKKRTVDVQVIADGGCLKDRYSKIPQLQKEGVAVYLYQPKDSESMLSDILHHKFVIFEKNNNDKSLVWTGSFNFTKSANVRNQENVVVMDDPTLVQQFKNQFERLKKDILSAAKALKAQGTSQTVAELGSKAKTHMKRAIKGIKII